MQQFQRQQEQLRKQKHEKHQLTQDQLHHQQGQVDQQKQQQFLKNFERSSALSGATVVNIAPSEQESLGGGSTMTGVVREINTMVLQQLHFRYILEFEFSNYQ